ADAAGVDDDQVGVEVVAGRLVAGRLEQPRHPFGVVDVHLTAVSLDEILHPEYLCNACIPARLAGANERSRLSHLTFAFARARFRLSPGARKLNVPQA